MHNTLQDAHTVNSLCLKVHTSYSTIMSDQGFWYFGFNPCLESVK